MSIKEHIESAKEELTHDEKLFAGLVRVERFYKKNRFAIIALVAILFAGSIGYVVMNYIKERKREAANTALLRLEKNPDDTSAMKQLLENGPKLAELFLLKKASIAGDIKSLESLKKSKDAVVSDLASYHLGVWKSDRKELENYRMKSGALLKEFALFDEAYLLMKKGKIKEAQERLSLIAKNSPLKAAAQMLEHYGVAEKQRGSE